MIVIKRNEQFFVYRGPPCVYPIVEKEELLQDLLVKIQDKSSKIFSSL